MINAGISHIELTSFVHPKAIPQLADSVEVAQTIIERYGSNPNLHFNALVPNVRGAENAVKCGLDTISVVISASESHNIENINRTVDESLRGLSDIINNFPELKVRLDVATAFGCPFEIDVPFDKIIALIDQALKFGVDKVVLCDTIGVADPLQTENLISAVRERWPSLPLALHMHDTRGMGIANILAGIQNGVTEFETSIGGLGGCPFAPGAAGNTATEDLCNMMDRMKIKTGIDMDKMYKVLYYVKDNIKSDLTGHMAKVGRKKS
jgi:hydroxymethylglutaryl-CoA lyase